MLYKLALVMVLIVIIIVIASRPRVGIYFNLACDGRAHSTAFCQVLPRGPLSLFKNKFIYLWLRWVFVAACGLSLVAASGGYSSLWCAGFSLRWLLLLQSTGSRAVAQ